MSDGFLDAAFAPPTPGFRDAALDHLFALLPQGNLRKPFVVVGPATFSSLFLCVTFFVKTFTQGVSAALHSSCVG